jgi:hypothetical protein
MTRRRFGRALAAGTGAVALLATAIVLAVSPGAGAAANDPAVIVETSWWTLATGAPKPAGGFQVAQSADGGDMSVAALKIRINTAHLGSALFVLNEATTSFRPDGAGILACVTTADWKAGNPGLWSDAPKRDCTRSVQMVRSATQLAWSADLLSLLAGKTGTVSVMFLPGVPGPGSLPVPSLDSLPITPPALPVPVVGGVPIPPPLPVPVPIPELPPTVAFPVQLGYMVDFSSVLLGAAETGAALSPSGPTEIVDNGSTSNLFFNDTSGGLVAAPPIVSTAVVTGGPVGPPNLALKTAGTSSPGRPWGRTWGFLVLALVVGVAGTVARSRLRGFGAGA